MSDLAQAVREAFCEKCPDVAIPCSRCIICAYPEYTHTAARRLLSRERLGAKEMREEWAHFWKQRHGHKQGAISICTKTEAIAFASHLFDRILGPVEECGT